MKYLFVLILILNSCSSDAQTSPRDMSDHRVKVDAGEDIYEDVADFGSFPDPNRESKKKCFTSLDCKRKRYCDKDPQFRLCRGLIGCGFFGKAPRDEDWACIINPIGGSGWLSGVECTHDSVCPEDAPYCYLRACQTNPRCKKDADCEEGQYCDWDSWCISPRPCEKDLDCSLDGSKCGENHLCKKRIKN